MSVSNDSTIFLEFCAKVRNNDPSILPAVGMPLKIREDLSEREDIELASALLENTSVKYLQLEIGNYTKSSAEAMAKYVRTSKHLQRIRWDGVNSELRQREEILCCFLRAIQESTSLKELRMVLPLIGGPSNLALEKMLTHTQSLQSLHLRCPGGLLVEGIALATARSGLEKNTTLRELTLDASPCATTAVSSMLTSLRDHPYLRKLCVHGYVADLTGLETVLLSDKITEMEIRMFHGGGTHNMMGLTRVLQALERHPALTKLELCCCCLGQDEMRLLRMVVCNSPRLQSLDLANNSRMLGSVGLTELAPALYHNTSIKVLDISGNNLNNIESAKLLQEILRCNTTITTLDLSGNIFWRTTGAVQCIADGLGSNSTLLKIDLSSCALGDGGVSTLAQTLGSRNTTLQKLTLNNNAISATGVGVLLEAMGHNSNHITDLDLGYNRLVGNDGASVLARYLGNNALPNLTRLSVYNCGIDDDGFIALVSALEKNTPLLQFDLRCDRSRFSELAYLALAESLPEFKVLQRLDFEWCPGLASAMPLLLAGLRKNTSLFRFDVADCAPYSVPPTPGDTAKFAGGWMQEMNGLGYRNRFRLLIRAPKERLPPHGVWPYALARVATLPDVMFEVLRSKPNLVPSEDTEGKEQDKAAEDTGVPEKRKCGDE
jgi:Ran GTPase-activating protein (RanGAP) involved in mRNA processing and transport